MKALYLYQATWSAYKRFVPKNDASAGDKWAGEANTSSQKAMASQFAVLLARLQALACRYLPLSRLSVYLSHKTFPCMDCTYPPTFTDIFLAHAHAVCTRPSPSEGVGTRLRLIMWCMYVPYQSSFEILCVGDPYHTHAILCDQHESVKSGG